MRILLAILATIIVVESTILALPYFYGHNAIYTRSLPQSFSLPFTIFNQPISNDTEHSLNPMYDGSWEVTVRSSLVPSSPSTNTEAEIAFAPSYANENNSIPTIIVQERADGLLRVEYFAQNWPGTFGLLLYNSSAPGWTGGKDVTVLFKSFGPPSQVNPQLAPRSNGNLTVLVGGIAVLPDYPIAWASLSEMYLYGYRGSSFIGGTVQISFYDLLSS